MIKIRNICKKFGSSEILKDISLDIISGEITVIWGPSGCGKTTLFNILSGLEKDFSGKVENLPARISYCFQEDRLLTHETVLGNICFVRKNNDEPLLESLLEIFHLDSYKNVPVKDLSGGQKQRVSIARALYYGSDLLLLDEPFKSLDIELKLKIISDLINFQGRNNMTIVMVTHDAQEAYLMADTIFTLNEKPTKVRDQFRVNSEKTSRSPFDIHVSEIFRDYYIQNMNRQEP